MNKTAVCAAVVSAAAMTSLSVAALPSYDFGDCLRALDCRRLDAAELDRMRGGFSFMTGSSELQVSIGISRAVFINDQLVAVTQDLVLPTLQELRNGTLPNATLIGAISAASNPASQRQSVPSDTTGAGGAPVASAGSAAGAVNGAPMRTDAQSSSSGAAAAVPAAASAPANLNPGAVQVNGRSITPGSPVVVDSDQLRALVIQNGRGNLATTSAADIRASTMATVLQNTLDNQTIRTLTTLTATSNALSAFRDAVIRQAAGQATTDLLQ